MEKFKVRDKVLVTAPKKVGSGKRKVFKGVIVNINDFREPNFKYAVELDDYTELVFVGEENLEGVF